MRRIFPAFLILFAVFFSPALSAQDLLSNKDLSTVKVDDLGENEISRIKTELKTKNITIDELEPMVLQRGMSITEFNKLKRRLEAASLTPQTKEENRKDPREDATTRMQ